MVDIRIEEYNNENNIVFIYVNENNVLDILEMLEFSDEMDYFGISLNATKHNNDYGYVYKKNITVKLLTGEIKRFVSSNNIENIVK